MKEKLASRLCLDGRLEEAFLLYAVLKTHFKYDLELEHVNHDRNEILRKVIDIFKERFEAKWSSEYASFVMNRYVPTPYLVNLYGSVYSTYR